MPSKKSKARSSEKGNLPLGESPSEIFTTSVSQSVGEDVEKKDIGIESLSTLPQDLLELLLGKKKEIEELVTRGFSEQAISPGIYKVEETTYWVCPENFFKEDEVIGAMIADFSRLTGAVIKTVPVPVNKTPLFNKAFVTGAWFGIYSTTNQKRRRSKKDYELGRTCSFALIVKNEFERIKELGPRALVADQFFFGNSEKERSKKRDSVSFCIKTKLRSYFDVPKLGDLVYGIINDTASYVGFSCLTEEEEQKVISDHLIPLDAVISKCYPETVTKRGNKKVSKVRKPNPIRASPLYLKEEIELISSLTNPLFTDLAELSTQYESAIFSQGFEAVERQIRGNIRVRWETLQRFANRTKLRLQAIRKITNSPTLRKANVTPSQIGLLLNSYLNPAAELVSDIIHITGAIDLRDAVICAYKKKFNNLKEIKEFLTYLAYVRYKRISPEAGSVKALDKEFNQYREPNEVDFENALKGINRITKYLGEFNKSITGFSKVKSFKLFGRTQAILGNMKLIETELNSLYNFDQKALDVAVRLTSEGLYKTYNDFITEINKVITEAKAYLGKSNQLRLKIESSNEVKTLIEGFQKSLDKNSLRILSLDFTNIPQMSSSSSS